MTIYKLTNMINGMSYIGATSSPINERFARHKYDAFTRNHKHPLAQALREYGYRSFNIESIYSADTREELYALECHAIAEHRTMHPHGYNMTIGGPGTVGFEWTEEMLANRPRTIHTVEQRAKWAAMRKGRSIPEHVKQKLSASLKGRPGRPISDEHKEKLRAINIGKKASPETRAKMSAAHKARHLKGTS